MSFSAELTVAYHRIAIHLDHESKYFHWFTVPREGLGEKRSKNTSGEGAMISFTKLPTKAIQRKGTFTTLLRAQQEKQL